MTATHDPTAHDAPTDAPPSSFFTRIASRLNSLRTYTTRRKRVYAPIPQTTQWRLDASLADQQPLDAAALGSSLDTAAGAVGDEKEKEKTVLYLAYGSNLCDETFRGVRGIRPISQVNVLVPELRLTFDLPGIPYSEPCFANTARRDTEGGREDGGNDGDGTQETDYHKDRWHKGLVGVVYEVTRRDYAHIIATEGGGSAYHDILVDCYVLPAEDIVPGIPVSAPFKAHTLFAPVQSESSSSSSSSLNTVEDGRTPRPNPSYAQPSARYLSLITSGATQRALPLEYRTYLADIRPYTITTRAQAAGKALFLALWMPLVILIFTLAKRLQDKRGRSPAWFARISAAVFQGMWVSYDVGFKRVFGDGERTVGQDEDGERKVWGRGLKKVVGGGERGGYAEKEALLESAVEGTQV